MLIENRMKCNNNYILCDIKFGLMKIPPYSGRPKALCQRDSLHLKGRLYA